MTTQPVTCASCGAQLQIDDEVDFLTCTYCGTAQIVRRGDGYIALKIADQLSQAIAQAGERTESTIRAESDETQEALRQLALRQDLSALQVQLATVQAEMRALQRDGRARSARSQLADLQAQETTLRRRIAQVNAELHGDIGPDMGQSFDPDPTPVAGPKSQMVALLLGLFFGVFGVHRFYTGHILIGVIQLVTVGGFGIWLLVDLITIGLGTFTDARGMRLRSTNPQLAKGCLFGALTYILLFLVLGAAAQGVETLLGLAPGGDENGPLVTLAGVGSLMAGIVVLAWLTNAAQIRKLFGNRTQDDS